MSNEHLSEEYWRAAIARGGDWATYKKHKAAIAACETDLGAHYDEHGSLREVELPGMGQWAIKEILEPVLRHGADEVLEEGQSGRDAELSWKVFSRRTTSGKVPKRNTRWKD
jgi:hypothetical protein